MKHNFLLRTFAAGLCAAFYSQQLHGQVGINTTTPDTNSVLDIVSTTKGVLIPRLDQTQVNALAALIPADGTLVYNATSKCVQIFRRTSSTAGTFDCLVIASAADISKDAWVDDNANTQVKLGTKSDGATARDPNTEVVINDDGKVGIGLGATTAPAYTLDLNGKIGVKGKQTVYNANAADYTGSLFLGDGGANLNNTADAFNASRNTGVGIGALNLLTTGYSNTAVGHNSQYSQTAANTNTSVGYRAMEGKSTGNSNVAIGSDVLQMGTTGSSNVALGSNSMRNSTSGSHNIAIGNSALYANKGDSNIAIGSSALNINSTGDYLTAVGNAALSKNTSGDYNVGVGYEALKENGTGERNAAVGYRALESATTSDNTAIGYQAGRNLTTGDKSTFVGSGAGQGITTGKGNVVVGTSISSLFRNASEYNTLLDQLLLLNRAVPLTVIIPSSAAAFGYPLISVIISS